MNPPMDDRRILAEIEDGLSRDDPELTSLIDTLNQQFPDKEGGSESGISDSHNTDSQDSGGNGIDRGDDDIGRVDWRWRVGVALAIIGVLGMILTALFGRSPWPDDDQVPRRSLAAAVAVHAQRRGSCPGAPIGSKPGRRRAGTDRRPRGRAHPPGNGLRLGTSVLVDDVHAAPWTPGPSASVCG